MLLYYVTVLSALILVTKQQNQPPRLNGGCVTSVREDIAVGSLLMTLNIIDDGPSLLPIVTPAATTKDLVLVNNTRQDSSTPTSKFADVILKKTLDRDFEPAQRQIVFEISDSQLTITVTCGLLILDVNDETPRFQNIPYRLTVNESQPNGTLVYKVTATDPDTGLGGTVYYSMTAQAQDADATYNTTFMVDRNTGDIYLNQPLDYEKRYYYQFLVHAEDGQGLKTPHPEPLAIIVEDVQDSPPEFVREPYMASVVENAANGTIVTTVTAYDGDRGVPNNVKYSFANDSYVKFSISDMDGVVRVAGDLDADDPDVRARGGVYEMTVQATEVTNEPVSNMTTATAKVTITVQDENDEEPRFNQLVYRGRIDENSPRGSPVNISIDIIVEDRDQGDNSRFKLEVLQGGNPFGGFTTLPDRSVDVTGKTSVILVVGNSSLLDFEQRREVNITIMAYETGTAAKFNNTAEVTIEIVDVNDNEPTFSPQQQTSFNVSEGASIGERIGVVNATDKDSGAFGKIEYSMEEDQAVPFQVNSSDGSILVAEKLDRETKASYTLFIVATDTPGGEASQRRSKRQRVDVAVTDVNDNDPKFILPPPQADIMENIPIHTTITTFSATDADIGENGTVTFSLVDSDDSQGLFDVRDDSALKTGMLIVNTSLIDHTGTHMVGVRVCDRGTPARCTNHTVSVFVRDVNLNRPEFVKPNASVNSTAVIEVEEELPLRSVLYTLKAVDKDEGANGNVTYFLEPDPAQDWQAFEVDRGTGELRNSRRLDRESKDQYQILISAKDQGIPQLVSQVVTVIVRLLDIDDNSPSFSHLQSPFRLPVLEERQGVSVNVSLATDADSDPDNRRNCYFLCGGDLLDHFQLNATSGLLYVIKALDRETQPKVNLDIQALGNCSSYLALGNGVSGNGGGGPSNANQAPPSCNSTDKSVLKLQLDVADINDQPPVFNPKNPAKGVLSDAAVGDEVFNLRDIVTDADVGENAVTYFRLTGPVLPSSEVSGDPVRLSAAFNVTVNGSVVVNMLFTANSFGHFALNVLAYDKGGLNDTAQLKLFIISDIQRLRLTFRKIPDEVKRLQNALIRKMEEILHFVIVVDKIASHQDKDGNVDESRTDMFIHARRQDTGEVVPAWELARSFDFNQQLNLIFAENGVVEAVPVVQQTTTEGPEIPIRNAFIIVAIALFLIAVSLLAVLINLRSRYRRKLRAATIKTPTYHHADELQPGTNMYIEAASNPLYNKKVRLIEEDTNSQNSLDENEVGGKGGKGEEEEEDEQELQMQFLDEVKDYENRQSSTLASVLNVYDSIKDAGSAQSAGHAHNHAPNSDHALPGQEIGRVNPAFQDNDAIPNGDARKMSLNIQSLEHTDL